MRILHTSDWHLGQLFYEHTREREHQAFLDWLVKQLAEQDVDLLIVAGDIYHTATPPSNAERMFFQFIKEAKQACPKLHIVVIAGNHDSAKRIVAARPLLSQFDTRVIGQFDATEPESVVFDIDTGNGSAKLVAMPFLRMADVALNGMSYPEGVARAYGATIEHALNEIAVEQPLIIIGHLHARGGDVSTDSERNLVIGGEEAIAAGVFGERIDYVALGHLHKAQTVAKNEAIRYSGTPFAMSFAERNYRHQVVLVDFSGAERVAVNPLYIPRFNDMLLLPEGPCVPLDVLCEQLRDLPDDAEGEAPYLRLRLASSETDSLFRERIEEALTGKAVRFCGIERVRAETAAPGDLQFEDVLSVESLNPEMLLEHAFAAHKDLAGAEVSDEVRQIFRTLLIELGQEEVL